MPPMPSHEVNDSATEDSVGNQTKAIRSAVGIAHITVRTTLSRRVSRLRRLPRLRRRRPGAGGVSGSVTTVIRLGGEDRLLLLLDLLREPGHVVGVLDEVLQRRDHD